MESAHLDHNVETGPPWGSLTLDSFMIDNWTPHSKDSDDDQRLALVRRFLAIGSIGRKQHAEKVASGTVKPTDTEIETILRPLRPIALRHVAKILSISSTHSGPVWLRTDYEDEERHKNFCGLRLNYVDGGEGLHMNSLILSDKRYYNVESWEKVLEYLPELVVDNYRDRISTEHNYHHGELRRQYERDYMEYESGGELEMCPDGDMMLLDCQQHCYVACFVIIEDREMFASKRPRFHALWLDDCGDVVREGRIRAEDACEYYVMVFEGAGAEQHAWANEAYIGPKYVSGAEYGPPFSVPESPPPPMDVAHIR